MEIDFEACMNVLAGFNAKGQTRLEEAEEWAQRAAQEGNPKLMEAIPALKKRIEEGEIMCGCNECGEWDGLYRRCRCDGRRVYWQWDDKYGWSPEVY